MSCFVKRHIIKAQFHPQSHDPTQHLYKLSHINIMIFDKMYLDKNTEEEQHIPGSMMTLKSPYQQQAILMIYLLICWRYLFPLPVLFSLLYWFSDKVGVLCQESHFPDDLAQSVHQPTTLVSTFLALTLIVLLLLQNVKKFVKYQNRMSSVRDNFPFIDQPTVSPPLRYWYWWYCEI